MREGGRDWKGVGKREKKGEGEAKIVKGGKEREREEGGGGVDGES